MTSNQQAQQDSSQPPNAVVSADSAQVVRQVPLSILGVWPSSKLRRRSVRELVRMPPKVGKSSTGTSVYVDWPKGSRISSGIYGQLGQLTAVAAFRSAWPAARLVGPVDLTIVPLEGMAGSGAEFTVAITGAPHVAALPSSLEDVWSGIGGVQMMQAVLSAPGATPKVDSKSLQRTEAASDLLWPMVQNALMSDPRIVVFTEFTLGQEVAGDKPPMFALGMDFTIMADESTW